MTEQNQSTSAAGGRGLRRSCGSSRCSNRALTTVFSNSAEPATRRRTFRGDNSIMVTMAEGGLARRPSSKEKEFSTSSRAERIVATFISITDVLRSPHSQSKSTDEYLQYKCSHSQIKCEILFVMHEFFHEWSWRRYRPMRKALSFEGVHPQCSMAEDENGHKAIIPRSCQHGCTCGTSNFLDECWRNATPRRSPIAVIARSSRTTNKCVRERFTRKSCARTSLGNPRVSIRHGLPERRPASNSRTRRPGPARPAATRPRQRGGGSVMEGERVQGPRRQRPAAPASGRQQKSRGALARRLTK